MPGVEPLARRLWKLLEPYHAVTYFAPEAAAAYEEVGLHGFWRGYFAGRAAPMGPVPAGPVIATFYGFAPAFVERALPGVWAIVDPATALDARLAGMDAALGRVLGGHVHDPALVEAAAIVCDTFGVADAAGRPIFAANVALPCPDAPHLALWHAATIVREHRGDGHVATLVTAGVAPVEAHLLQVLANGATLDSVAPYRGWSDEDWEIGAASLRGRGWMEGEELTQAGLAARDELERTTDRLAAQPLHRLGADRTERLLELVEPFAHAVVNSGTIRYPNPIGVPMPERA
jgi:hypothetical protein